MPITLVTGLPGHGKTLYTIVKVKELSEQSRRPVFYHGINDLKLPWHKMDDAKQWNELPEGSIIVIDECQDLFPVHETKLASLDYVLQLAKHRHKGFDIWLISQHPMNIHPFVRRLIDKHFHTIRAFGMQASNFHEWNRVQDSPEKIKKDGQTKLFNYPKDAFNYYHSAEVHTIKRKIPNKVKALVIIPFLLAGLAWKAYSILNPQHQRQKIMDTNKNAFSNNTINGPPGQALRSNEKKDLTYIEAHTPEIRDLVFTAPIYKDVVKPIIAPYPAACVLMHNVCKCYTQQATLLDTTQTMCLQIVKKGFFVDWQLPQQLAQTQRFEPRSEGVSGRSPDVDKQPMKLDNVPLRALPSDIQPTPSAP